MIRRQKNKARLIVKQAKFDYDILLDTVTGKIANCIHYIRASFTDIRSKKGESEIESV